MIFCSYVLWDIKPSFIFSLFLIFFAKIKTFILLKLLLYKKECFRGFFGSDFFLSFGSGIFFSFCIDVQGVLLSLIFFVNPFRLFHGLVQLSLRTGNICHHYFFGCIVVCLSFNHLGKFMYDPPQLRLMTFVV